MRALVNNCNHGLEFTTVSHPLFDRFTLRTFVAPSLVSSTLVKVPDQIFASICVRDTFPLNLGLQSME